MLVTIQSRTFCLLVCCRKNIKIGIYKTIILPEFLYGREIWSLILRENMVLRKMFGPKKDQVEGAWRNLHYEELRDFVLFIKYN
jgi:hypothetical protein